MLTLYFFSHTKCKKNDCLTFLFFFKFLCIGDFELYSNQLVFLNFIGGTSTSPMAVLSTPDTFAYFICKFLTVLFYAL